MAIEACPFCACDDPDKVVVNGVGRMSRVYCHGCGAAGPIADTDELAIEAFNYRPPKKLVPA